MRPITVPLPSTLAGAWVCTGRSSPSHSWYDVEYVDPSAISRCVDTTAGLSLEMVYVNCMCGDIDLVRPGSHTLVSRPSGSYCCSVFLPLASVTDVRAAHAGW